MLIKTKFEILIDKVVVPKWTVVECEKERAEYLIANKVAIPYQETAPEAKSEEPKPKKSKKGE